MEQRHNISGDWDVVIGPTEAFIQYRGIDVVSVWLPADDPDQYPYLIVAERGQFMDWVIDPEDGEVPYTEWARPGEIDIGLADHVIDIDRALEALQTRRHLVATERTLKDVMDQPHASREDLKSAIFEYLDARGEA